MRLLGEIISSTFLIMVAIGKKQLIFLDYSFKTRKCQKGKK